MSQVSLLSLDSAQLAEMVLKSVSKVNQILDDEKSSEQNNQQIKHSWIITAFNVLIEYIPYKHVMEEIFLCCNINLNDDVFHELTYPNTSNLESKFNYYDVPDLYIENVSTTIKNQPSFVFMIGL